MALAATVAMIFPQVETFASLLRSYPLFELLARWLPRLPRLQRAKHLIHRRVLGLLVAHVAVITGLDHDFSAGQPPFAPMGVLFPIGQLITMKLAILRLSQRQRRMAIVTCGVHQLLLGYVAHG